MNIPNLNNKNCTIGTQKNSDSILNIFFISHTWPFRIYRQDNVCLMKFFPPRFCIPRGTDERQLTGIDPLNVFTEGDLHTIMLILQ